MTSPVGGKPEPTQDRYNDVHSIGSSFGADLDESSVRSLLGYQVKSPFASIVTGVANAFGSLINDIADAITGIIPAGARTEPIKNAIVAKMGPLESEVQALGESLTELSAETVTRIEEQKGLIDDATTAIGEAKDLTAAVKKIADQNKKDVASAISKADKANSALATLTPKITDAVSKANKASSDVSTLTPKVTAAQSKANSAFAEAEKVRSEVNSKIEEAQTKGETALAAADKAIADSEFVAGLADDLIPKDENGKSTWNQGMESIDVSPEGSAFGSERTALMENSFTFPVAFNPVKGQEVYRLTVWIYRDPNSRSGGFSFHVLDEDGQRRWVEARLNLGVWTPLADRTNLATIVNFDTWEKHVLDFRWPEHLGPAKIRFQLNNGSAFYIHDPQVRVIQPLDNSVDQAQNDAIRANTEILRQQQEINAQQEVFNNFQTDFNKKQTAWNEAVDRSIATQKTVNDNFEKWTEGATKAITANADATEALARINGIQVGGRNLLKESLFQKTSSDYLIHRFPLGDSKPQDGEEVTFSIKAKPGEGNTRFRLYNSNGNGSSALFDIYINEQEPVSDGVYKATGKWKVAGGNSHLNVYAYPSSVKTPNEIEWVKLERGNQATDWTPAPEDLPTQAQVDDAQNKAIQANTEFAKQQEEINLMFQEQLWTQQDMIDQLDIQATKIYFGETSSIRRSGVPSWVGWSDATEHIFTFVHFYTRRDTDREVKWQLTGSWTGRVKVTTNWSNGAADIEVFDVSTSGILRNGDYSRTQTTSGGAALVNFRNVTFEVFPTNLNRRSKLTVSNGKYSLVEEEQVRGFPSMIRYQGDEGFRFSCPVLCDKKLTLNVFEGGKWVLKTFPVGSRILPTFIEWSRVPSSATFTETKVHSLTS